MPRMPSQTYEYKLVTHADVPTALVKSDEQGPIRVAAVLNKLGADGWHVLLFEHENFGLKFWALLERAKEVGTP